MLCSATHFKSLVFLSFRDNPSHVRIFVSGATARSCAVLVLMPVNVIKIRFEVQYHINYLLISD